MSLASDKQHDGPEVQLQPPSNLIPGTNSDATTPVEIADPTAAAAHKTPGPAPSRGLGDPSGQSSRGSPGETSPAQASQRNNSVRTKPKRTDRGDRMPTLSGPEQSSAHEIQAQAQGRPALSNQTAVSGAKAGKEANRTSPSGRDSAFDYLVDAASEDQEGLFPMGEVSLVAGPSGAGKTTWLLQFILALRSGKEFFGRKTNPRPYAFLLFDRSENGLKRTCRRMRINLDELNPYRPTGEEAIERLPSLIKRLIKRSQFKETKVFFIEGLDMLVPEGKTADLTAVARFLDQLQRVAQANGLAIIGSVGSPKMKANDRYQSPRDRIYGSVGWGRKAETIIYLEQKDANKPDSHRQLWILPRNGKEEQLTFRWENGRLVENNDQGRLTTEQRVVQWMEKDLKPGGDFQLKQVASALGCPDSTAQSALEKLVGVGRVGKPRHGWYRRLGPAEETFCIMAWHEVA